MESQMGFYGLGVMGRNLCLNLLDHGVRLCVTDFLPVNIEPFAAMDHPLLQTAASEKALCAQLEKPRRIFLMIKAGPAVDETIARFLPYLEPGDILMDGGNSYFQDTIRRSRELATWGIRFLGIGVSGGASGARSGPSLMAGGDRSAYDLMAPVLTAITAQVKGEPCCTYTGADGSGHFVKTVHNGIEYADMQLISEVYDLASRGRGLAPADIGRLFAGLNTGVSESYLMTISAEILGTLDPLTGEPLVAVINDQAAQNGTGNWAVQAALRLGMPATLLASAVFARSRSADRELRRIIKESLRLKERAPAGDAAGATGSQAGDATGATGSQAGDAAGATDSQAGDAAGIAESATAADPSAVEPLARALLLGRILTYAEGFSLMKAAARQHGWDLDLAAVARIFRGGCIIRSGLLEPIANAYAADPDLPHLLADAEIVALADACVEGLVETARAAIDAGLPAPVLTAAASELRALSDLNLPTSLIQAQRDYFGAHTFRRKDRDGRYHFDFESGTLEQLP